MKKLFSSILILVFIILSLSSCAISEKRNAPKICAEFSVPYLGSYDLRNANAKELETDSYGRVLIEYEGYSDETTTIKNGIIYIGYEKALVICQKYYNSYVYYYEDKNYLLYDYTDEDIERLKEENDWEKPFDESKMSKRPTMLTLDGVVCYNSKLKIKNEWLAEQLGIDYKSTNLFIDRGFEDVDNIGNELYLFYVGEGEEQKIYYAIISPEYEVAFLEMENRMVDPAALSEFKQANGWHYGID